MEMILNILPQEVLDNFSLAQAAKQVDVSPPLPQRPVEEPPKVVKDLPKVRPVGRKKHEASAVKPKLAPSSKDPTPTVSLDEKSSD